jgi:hypothetical protein
MNSTNAVSAFTEENALYLCYQLTHESEALKQAKAHTNFQISR